MTLTVGDRVTALRGVSTGQQGTIVGYLVRIDGDTSTRSYMAASVEPFPGPPVLIEAPEISVTPDALDHGVSRVDLVGV